MKTSKQYAVEVLQKHQHGRYGKDFYFGMYLPGFSKKDAEQVGLEVLSSMTFNEIDSRCVDGKQKPWHIWYGYKPDEPIGFETAEFFFSCKAYIE